MKFESCDFSVLDTVTISNDDTLLLPAQFNGVNDVWGGDDIWIYWRL